MNEDQWHDIIDTNLTGVFHSVKAAIPALKNSQRLYHYHRQSGRNQFFANGAAYNANQIWLVLRRR